MPLKAYFQDQQSPAGPVRADTRMTAVVWHLGWSGFILLGLIGMLLLPASPFVLGAMVIMTLPGICAVGLLISDTQLIRQGLVVVWALAAFMAVGLTGGISGPLAAWIALPMAAAVVLNQRLLITLGVTLAFVVSLLTAMVSLSQRVHMPDDQEALWLSFLAIFSLVVGLGVALLPALRIRVEQAQDAEEGRSRALKMLTEQPQLILCLDDIGRVISAYGEAPAGMDLKALMQGGVVASAHVPDRLAVRAALDDAMSEGRSEAGFMPHAALDHFVHLSLRRGSDNRLYGTLSDASLQHAREARLETSRAEAEHLNQGKTQFLASMSHELRTPLNAVIGFSDIMRQQLFGPLSEKYTEYAQLIWESGQHVLDMINDVLDMSKIEAQKYRLTLETFDMREPVSAALRLMRGTAHDKQIDIKSLLPSQALMVSADKRAIKQICLNLLSNAIKFTPEGGAVTFSLKQVADHADITLTDSGIGIAPDDLDRIGQPYEQSGTSEQKAMGTGLGLSIVKAMAHLHGGKMTLASTLGEGTSVTVDLPVVIAGVDMPEDVTAPVVNVPLNPLQDHTATPDALNGFGAFVIRPPKS